MAFCGVISIFTTLGIVFELGKEAWLFFGDPNISVIVERDPDFARTSLLQELRRSLLVLLGASPAPPEEIWERLNLNWK